MSATAAAIPVARESALKVGCVDDFWGFNALRADWNELLRASAADNPFLTWEWLNAWWKHLHGTARLRIVTVRDGYELIAVAPLMETPGGLRWFSRLEFLGTGFAGSDYLDVIVRRGREAVAIAAVAGYLKSRGTAIRFDHLPPESFGAQVAAQLAGDGWPRTELPGGVCPVIPLAGHTWDSYLATVGSAHRANVRRRLRAIEQKFAVRFERVTTDRQRRDALTLLAKFHETRFEQDGTAFITPEMRAFQDEATRRALERGWLRMYVLRLNDKTVAVMYGFLYNRQFYFYQHGFDDQFRAHSVGLVLMALSVQEALAEGAQTFDMLWGVESYKWLWTRETRLLQRIDLFPPRIGGTVHRAALEARRTLGALKRRVRRGAGGGAA